MMQPKDTLQEPVEKFSGDTVHLEYPLTGSDGAPLTLEDPAATVAISKADDSAALVTFSAAPQISFAESTLKILFNTDDIPEADGDFFVYVRIENGPAEDRFKETIKKFVLRKYQRP